MLHKNLTDSVRRGILLRRRLLDTLAWVKFVVSGDKENAAAVLKAHRDFRTMRAAYTRHPKENLLNVDTNIIFDYYVRNRRKFSQLKV